MSITGATRRSTSRGHTFQLEFACDPRLELDRTVAKSGPGMGQTLDHQLRYVRCHFGAVQEGNLHNTAIERRRLIVAFAYNRRPPYRE